MAYPNRIFDRFLQRQLGQGMALAADSDLLELIPLEAAAATKTYMLRLRCIGLVRRAGQVVEHDDFLVGIHFPDAYLHRFDTARVLSWCRPFEVWQPSVKPPFVCVGRMQPGTPLVDLIYQVFEIITYHNFETREHNALNPDACAWARNNLHRFPVDRRPLRWRKRLLPNVRTREE